MLPKGGHGDFNHLEPVIKVLPECAIGYSRGQIPVGGGNDPDIRSDGFFAAQPCNRLILQDAQDFGLSGQRHIANFIQEDGSSVRQFKFAFFLLRGSGKGAFFVTEKLTFHKGFRNGGAI
jgi:hypothetical protein